MTRKWLVPDPEPDVNGETGYMTVYYSKPRTQREIDQRRHRAEKRAVEREQIQTDPMTDYETEKKFIETMTVRRLRKHPSFSCYTTKQLYRHVQQYSSSDRMPIVLSKTSGSGQAERRKAAPAGSRKFRKIEQRAEAGDYEIKKFTPKFIEAVTRARNSRNMTQAELAKLVNVTENDIARFEKGEATYSGALFSTLTWKLGLS